MLFNSYEFIFIFLPIVFIGYYLIAKTSHPGAIIWLAFASLFFYGYWSLYSLPILVSSVCINYWFGLQVSNQQSKHRKTMLVLALIFNLSLLAYFKYTNFFIDNTNILRSILGLNPIQFLNIVLPIGISFFTFTQIAFIMDSYQDKVKERKFFDYLLFVTFFPHLIAGPVIHHAQVMPQFLNLDNFKINTEKIVLGIVIFTIGLSKKLLLADPLGEYADILFNGVNSGLNPQLMISWMGSFAYTLQLYFDFSGYSDMAVGLSLLFGIWLPINFNAPFKATNIIDFWQRWHISLTKYIGEYLYTPITLKMMRVAQGKSAIADIFLTLVFPTLLVFLILGLWHGPNWTYVIFGGMHGVFIVSNHLWRKVFPISKKKSSRFLSFRSWLGWAATIISVNLSFIIFRSESLMDAGKIYKGILGLNDGIFINSSYTENIFSAVFHGIWQFQLRIGQSTKESILLLLLGLFIVVFMPSTADIASPAQSKYKVLLTQRSFGAMIVGLLFVLSLMQLGKTSPFLYFQF
jgi:alginate O-acetyltransferase complex protein AlgI